MVNDFPEDGAEEMLAKMAEMAAFILTLPESELRSVPQDMVDELYYIMELGFLPDEVARELRKKLDQI